VDSALWNVLTGAGVAGVFCLLFVLGLIYPKGVVDDLKEENKELKEALSAQRDRSDSAVTAASATRDILAAIKYGRELTSPPDHGGSP
jgi:hypothetical protein